jgi:phosphotransferase system enzyme I (PtsP)
MPAAFGGPRVLLRRLREVMAQPTSPQEKLDRIVVLVASNMVAEVCSIYVQRTDGALELYATEGLKREAVHLTTMQSGEGLVGLIAQEAEALALSDAQAHPAFSYKPETGEEIYRSFLGVPVLRAGATLGVVVVQNTATRVYTEEEIEALQTVSMVLAELIAQGGVQALAAPGQGIALKGPLTQQGVSLSEGVGLGYAVLHEPRVVIRSVIADNPEAEVQRLETAIAQLRSTIDELIARGDVSGDGEHAEVLETFRMFAHDQGWMRRMREAVFSGLTAEAAVERVQSDTRARMTRQKDPYLRERLHDLDDLANRLLHILVGAELTLRPDQLPDNAILVARSMGPAALLDYNRERLRGLVLEEGGPTSHVAIVARALGIPAVSEIANVTALLEQGDAVIVDGATGEIQIRPKPDVENAYKEKARLRARRQEQYRKLRDTPAVTKDGRVIDLKLNAGLLIDVPHVAEMGFNGIGLFRTELQFMVAARMPTTAEQQQLYASVLRQVGDRPVTFRTLDIGGDKVLPYMQRVEEENPALGWRAIRIGLDRPGLLRSQVRAMLRAAAGRSIRIMLPMIASVDEFIRARALVQRELSLLDKHARDRPAALELGVMVEVPSLLFEIDEIAREADFLSVGSNDLMQFLFAADRENRLVADRFDSLSVSALRALKLIADAGQRAGCPVTVCGEMGGRAIEAMALLALGFNSLSMTPSSVGPVKAMVLKLDAAHASRHLAELLASTSGAASLRPALKSYAQRHDVPL